MTDKGASFTPPPEDKSKAKKKTSVKKTDIADVAFEEIKEEKKTDTENIDLKELKDSAKDEKIPIDFMSGDFIGESLGKQTKKSEAPVEEIKVETEQKSIKDVQEEIKQLEDEKNKELKPQDYEEISALVINIIDFLMSSLLKWWGKDTSDAAYSLPEAKKKVLVSQLSLLLIKHQQKWSIEFLFILTIIAVYSGPVMAARANRKNPGERKAGRPNKK